ncbi:MAG: outer membrane lipoprotein-sorting protein [Thermodesulfobacteriota bacterium]
MKRIFTLLLLLTLGTTSSSLAAPTADEIVNKANLASYYGGDDGKSQVEMIITDGQGRTRQRLFNILRQDVEDGGPQLFFVYFKKPSDVRKTTFLVHKFIDKDDDRWMYLPSLDLVKRIAAADKRTSFMGSHFLYEDVSGRNITADTHKLVEETAEHYILDNVPVNPEGVRFASYRIWIDKKNYMPTRTDYLDKAGKVYRRVEVLESKVIDAIPTVTLSKASNLEDGGHTVATFSKIKYNLGLKDSIFSERYLRRPPREARK